MPEIPRICPDFGATPAQQTSQGSRLALPNGAEKQMHTFIPCQGPLCAKYAGCLGEDSPAAIEERWDYKIETFLKALEDIVPAIYSEEIKSIRIALYPPDPDAEVPASEAGGQAGAIAGPQAGSRPADGGL